MAMDKALDSYSPDITGMTFAETGAGQMPTYGQTPERRAGLSTRTSERRRKALLAAAKLAPGLTARHLAKRYLCSAANIDRARLCGAGKAEFLPSGEAAAVLRHAPMAEPTGQRILLVHGHDGNVRQFGRMIRALQNAGAEVDALLLPGHIEPDRDPCSIADITRAIHDCARTHGPYDGAIAHCVSANGLIFALEDGLECGRVVLISAPLDQRKLLRLGGSQYGIEGDCLERFVDEVVRLSAPYPAEAPWRAIAATRSEPMLAVHARNDYAAPAEDLEPLADVWAEGRIEIFENADHNTIVGQSAPVQCVTDFLTRDFRQPDEAGAS